ncbi:MAG: AAA family ATPase [Stigonema ocellatum SAG 48.90 = DSM 106950]|nr:AAA family ATPase [Stigonema ocellatum SAG 48.90 = DSM 106950]
MDIELSELPSVSLNARQYLPACSAIYMVIDSLNQVLYVGKASNLQIRWQRHHRLEQLNDIDKKMFVRIAWLVCEQNQLDKLEVDFIAKYSPLLNNTPVTKEKEKWKSEMINMTTVISIINLKGGVGKTTTTIQLAECLASEFSKRVLVIDLDPQTNATVALIGEESWEELDQQKQTLFHLFNDKLEGTSFFNIDNAIQPCVSNLKLSYLSLLSSSIKFIDIQDRISEISHKSNYCINPMEVLKTGIHSQLKNYDYVFIDCPPNLGFITINGIEISDYFLIPTIPDTLSTYGIPQVVKTIYNFKKDRNLPIECLGLIMTKYSSNSNAHRRGKNELSARFAKIFQELHIPQSPVFETVIPQANATAEAMEFGANISTFRQKYGRSKCGDRYLYEYVINLANEFIKHVIN